MTRKPHPADEWGIEVIDVAEKFNVHMRRGPGNVDNREAATLAEAVKVYDQMAAEATGGRKPLMYAIEPGLGGRVIHVPLRVIDEARAGAR